MEPASADDSSLTQLFELCLDLLCVAGVDGHFKRVNPAFTHVLGWSEEELLARPFLEFVHPDDVAATLAEVEKLAIGGYVTIQFLNRYKTADDQWRWLSWQAQAGSDGLLYAVARDVTEIRELNEVLQERAARFEAVVNNAPNAVITITPTGAVEVFNPAAQRMFGYPAEAIVGRNVNVLMTEEHAPRHDGYVERYRRTGVARILGSARELEARRADGSVFPIELRVSAYLVDETEHYLGIVSDITERRRMASVRQTLEEMHTREAVHKGRIETSAGILHDLGNALTGVGARTVDARSHLERTEALRQFERTIAFLRTQTDPLNAALDGRGDALVTMLDSIHEAMTSTYTEVSFSLKKALTYLSHSQELLTTHRRYASTSPHHQPERLAVRELLLDAQLMLEDAMGKRKGVIVVDTPDENCRILSERGHAMQLLLNITRNAVEAFDGYPAPVAPRVQLVGMRLADGSVRIEVRDNGPGFTEGNDAFAEGYSTKNRGSGQGLAVARRITQALGGSIELLSPGPGRGAVVRVRLPGV